MTAKATAARDALFDEQTSDPSVWHSMPHSAIGFGRITPDPTREQGADLDTSAEQLDDGTDRRRWPSLGVCCGSFFLAEAFNCWVEGEGVGKKDFVRREWHWHPHYLSGTWTAGPVELTLSGLVSEKTQGLLRVVVRNTGPVALRGTLVFGGDNNVSNCNGRTPDKNADIHYWPDRTEVGEASWPDADVVSVAKVNAQVSRPQIMYSRENAWKEEDRQDFERSHRVAQFAFAFPSEPGAVNSNPDTSDGFMSWRREIPLECEAGDSIVIDIGFGGGFMPEAGPVGYQQASDAVGAKCVAAARDALAAADWDAAVAERADAWRELLGRAPVPQGEWSEAVLKAYFKAWTVAYYNIAPPVFDLEYHRPKHTLMMCNKVSLGCFTVPASWEAALGALLMTLVEPETAVEVMKSIYDTIQEDGFIAECIGRWRNSALANVEPIVSWAAYRKSGDRAFLEAYYEKMRANHTYKTFHPWWRHLTGLGLRNLMYNCIAGHYFVKIARELDRPEAEIAKFERLAHETLCTVDGFWDEDAGFYRDGYDMKRGAYTGVSSRSACLAGLYLATKPKRIPEILEFVKREFLTEDGIIAAKNKASREKASGKHAVFALKPSNYYSVLKGLKDSDEELCQRVCRGSAAVIAASGDFHEEHGIDGTAWHNGPGSLFGAFGLIWCVLMAEGLVDDIYE